MTGTLEEIWPPSGLVVESGDLRMTALREADVPEVLDVVAGGIHDPSWTPFAFPWTDAPAEEIPANYMRFFASTLARTQGGGASIELVVRRGGRVVGMQAMNGADVAGSRRMETGRGQAERRGMPTTDVFFELRPDEFVRGDDPVRITGADELRRFLGLT